MGRDPHRWRGGMAVLILASLLVGCGGSSHPQTGSGTVFGHTLATIGGDPSVRAFLEFGDIAAERSLAGVPAAYGAGHAATRWRRILGFGADYFIEDPGGTRDGLDTLTGAVALEIGLPPHTGGLITGPGVDGAKVRAAVEKLGATSGTVAGQPGLVWGAEGQTHPTASNQFGIGPALGEFDRAVITAHTVIAARFESEVATLARGGSHPAAKDPLMAATASCLGDVVAADAIDTATLRPGSPGAPGELAAGVRRPASPASAAQEVLCVVPGRGGSGPSGATICSRIGPNGPSLPGPTTAAPSEFDVSAQPSSGATDGTRWSGCTVTDRSSIPAGWLLTVLAQPRGLAALSAPN